MMKLNLFVIICLCMTECIHSLLIHIIYVHIGT